MFACSIDESWQVGPKRIKRFSRCVWMKRTVGSSLSPPCGLRSEIASATANPLRNRKTAGLMAESSSPSDSTTGDGTGKSLKLRLIPLIFLIYFQVSGGPYGEEPAVKAAGPVLAIAGFILFPFVWSIPEALVTAELATAFPGNGGYVLWAWHAFGPFCGFLMGWSKWFAGVINNAAYPALCLDYLAVILPSVAAKPLAAAAAKALYVAVLTYLNYAGLDIVGTTAVVLGAVSLLPFFVLAVVAVPQIRPENWLRRRGGGWKTADWGLYFNTLFWNLNFWDNASTLAGEVADPQTTFPTALLLAGILTVAGYVVPLVAATGAIDGGDWSDGYLAVAAGQIAGGWLKLWIEAGAVLSTVGLFEAALSSAAYQLDGMAGIGIIPEVFCRRSAKYNTPVVGILASAGGTLLLTFTRFTDIVAAANFLYSCGMLLEFAAFLWLRRKKPALHRPFTVPLSGIPMAGMCAVPTVFLVFVMLLARWAVLGISCGIVAAGMAAYFALGECRRRRFLVFKDTTDESEAYGLVSPLLLA